MDKSKVLERGLAVLEYLAARQSASLSEVVAALGLSPPAASRALEALCAAGYLARRRSRDPYRLTAKVVRLGHAHALDVVVRETALPLMSALTASTGWPVLLGKVEALDLVVLETTAPETRRGVAMPSVGERMPYFLRAAGTVCVAFKSIRERERVVEQSSALRRKHGLTLVPRNLEVLHATARAKGFIEFDPVKDRPASLAVPLAIPDHDYGLELCYRPDALHRAVAVKEHLPRLRQIAKAVQAAALQFLPH